MRGEDSAVRNLRPRNGSGDKAEQDGGAGQAVSAGRAGAGVPEGQRAAGRGVWGRR